MSNPRASIIIRCYNEQEHIGKLLHGVFDQQMDDFEVFLVDSGSTDGTLEIARRFPIDDVIYIDPEEFSFGRALNYGCEAANGEFCIFASAHVYPRRRDWLDRLLEKFEDSEVALVYGKQRGNELTQFPEKRVFERWFPETDRDRQQSPFCNNANAAIRRSLHEAFPYDEELTGLEDIDWAKRVQEAGYEISYASEAEIVHVHDETPKEVFDRYRREAIAHKHILPGQEFSLFDFLTASARNILADFRAAADDGVLLDSLVEIPRFRLMQFWGTYRGFAQETPVSEQLWQRFYYPDTESYPDLEVRGDGDADLEIDYPDHTTDD